MVQGKIAEEGQQDTFLCVVDATNLKLHLGLVLEMIQLGRPMLVVLNMMDEARRRGMQINTRNCLNVWVYLWLKLLPCVLQALKT